MKVEIDKKEIEEKLFQMELEKAYQLIREYEKEVPADMDLISYYTVYYIYCGELEKALFYALKGVRRYPVNGDMLYNLANVYELRGELFLAGENYTKAQIVYSYIKDAKAKTLQIPEKLVALMGMMEENVKQYSGEKRKNYNEEIRRYQERYKSCFGLSEPVYRDPEQIIGKYIWVSAQEKRYVAVQKAQYSKFVEKHSWDLLHLKGELLNVEEGKAYQVNGDYKEYLLPIAVQEKNILHLFKQNEKKFVVLQRENRHFNYYKVKNGTLVDSSGLSYYGNPIPLGHDAKRKKLVLNIFVDGLSQEILNGTDFEKIMPHTYHFFKNGTICTQAYSTAEWTYPSLANYVTGLDTLHHMMFHNELEGCLPEEVPTLAEYFKEQGYVTTKMDGDWRSVPSYGHARGYDRVIYQNQVLGSKHEEMIGDTIEQLEGLKDTDHFMWICMGDLHDIADGYDLSFGVQTHLELENRVKEDIGETSVKQFSSANKIEGYKKMVYYTDKLLEGLYHYIQMNYDKNEFIVSLFADHGQGYLVPEGEHFICKERTKVAFMFAGDVQRQISDEIISTSDYVSIMNKLAGIPMKNVETTGNLPVCFGGKKEREYAMSECLHPKDVYCATFYTKENTIYFENGLPTREDGRFVLKDYKINVTDCEGNQVDDNSLREKYLQIVLEHIAPLRVY